MRADRDHEANEPEVCQPYSGADAANLLDGWRTVEQALEMRDLPSVIVSLRSGPVLSASRRRQLARLLERLGQGKEPFEPRRRKRGRPRKSMFNYASGSASSVAAEYMLALCTEGGWGAKPNALKHSIDLAHRLYPGHDLGPRLITSS